MSGVLTVGRVAAAFAEAARTATAATRAAEAGNGVIELAALARVAAAAQSAQALRSLVIGRHEGEEATTIVRGGIKTTGQEGVWQRDGGGGIQRGGVKTTRLALFQGEADGGVTNGQEDEVRAPIGGLDHVERSGIGGLDHVARDGGGGIQRVAAGESPSVVIISRGGVKTNGQEGVSLSVAPKRHEPHGKHGRAAVGKECIVRSDETCHLGQEGRSLSVIVK